MQCHVPHRFEVLPPAIFLKHYVKQRTPRGDVGPPLVSLLDAAAGVWLSGQERISIGDPHWEHLPEQEVEALLGREEMQAQAPSAIDER